MNGKNLDELEQLRRCDNRYHAALFASAAIVWIASPDGEFVERQPGWEAYTGQTWDEYQYSKWISAIHPDDRPQVTADWIGAVGSGGPVYRTQGRVWSARHRAWRTFQTRGVPVRDKTGRIIEWAGALTDVQDAVEAQEQAVQREAQARRAAERASEEKTRFLAAASHDLRQPMQALATLIGILAARPRDPDETALVNRADRAMRSLSDLLNALLDFSQLDAGVIRPNLDSFPAQRLLDAMREEFEIEASEKKLQFTVQNCPCWLLSDPALLARMVRNLVSNAVKYTPSGGRVTVVCHQEEGRIRLEVRDTGRGIRPEMHDAIFEEFRRIGNPQRDDRKGLGLGLSIVRRMAQLLDHEIAFRSSPGAGSSFTIGVPAAQPAIEEAHSEFSFAGGQRVLLVDDNELVAEVLVSLLADAGNEVVTASSAEDALAIVQSAETAFDAVISDYRLPTLSGLDVIEGVRRRWPAATAVILSGDTFDPRLQGLSKIGVKVLRKPVRRETLAQALESGAGGGAAGPLGP
jgi:PAS domain S-box-containing protein